MVVALCNIIVGFSEPFKCELVSHQIAGDRAVKKGVLNHRLATIVPDAWCRAVAVVIVLYNAREVR